MARKCKCQICGKELTIDKAYKITKGKRNLYYCDSIEYEIYIEEKEKNKKHRNTIHEYIDKILGYKCISNQVNKEISELNKLYELEDILELLKDKMDSLSELIVINDIDIEYNKIRYIFGALSRDIHDFAAERIKQKRKEEMVKTNIEDINKQFSIEQIDHKFKAKETTDFSSFF